MTASGAEGLPPVRVGVTPAVEFWTLPWHRRRELMDQAADVGIDHVYFADHVSFRSGHGNDGMVTAAALLNLHPTIGVYLGVYLLPLRHPVLVARQLANLAEMGPGRVSFGVGIGGDDRHEVEVCGVDPSTRGRRCDESLEVVQALLAGETVNHDGEFFKLDEARITPVPAVRLPTYVGGRSDAALRRAARFADGWLGIWCSPDRYASAVAQFAELQEELRPGLAADTPTDHGIQLWVGLGRDRKHAASLVGRSMERFYHVPFERFERYTPHGTVDDVVEFLTPYLEAGCRHFNLTPVGEDYDEGVAAIGEVRARLRAADAGGGG